jgi:hypothetical protein
MNLGLPGDRGWDRSPGPTFDDDPALDVKLVSPASAVRKISTPQLRPARARCPFL